MFSYIAMAASIASIPKIAAAVSAISDKIRQEAPTAIGDDVEALVAISEVLCVKKDDDSNILIVAKNLLASAVAELQTIVYNYDHEKEQHQQRWLKSLSSFNNEDHVRRIDECCRRVKGRISMVEKYTPSNIECTSAGRKN